jgi:signal peptidase II
MERRDLIPLALAPAIVLLDQATKIVVERAMPLGRIIRVWGDFLWLWHVRNTAMAFSLGVGLPESARTVVFAILPVAVLAALVVYYLRSRDLTTFQRWCFAAILGGGAGNLIDRLFRVGGVVDFVSVKFYGIFGLERWPTFNVADSTVVVAGLALLVSFVREGSGSKHA